MKTGWEAYKPFREAIVALDPLRYPADYIDRQVWAGFWRCWGTEDAAILAELRTYPSGVFEVHGIAAAGDLDAIIALIPKAEDWGRSLGAIGAVIESRPGWIKALPDYQLFQAAMRKDL